MRRNLALAFAALVIPAAAFVYVPTRGQAVVRQVISLPAGGPAEVTADELGNVFAVSAQRVSVTAGAGLALGGYDAPAGYVIDRPLVTTAQAVVVVARDEHRPGRATLTALRLTGARAERLWSLKVDDLAANGVHAPQRAGADTQPRILALVADREARGIDSQTGQERWRRPLGTVVGPVLWVRDSGFVSTTDGSPKGQGAPAVLGFDAVRPDTEFEFVWLVPAGEAITRLSWLDAAGQLAAYGLATVYLLNE